LSSLVKENETLPNPSRRTVDDYQLIQKTFNAMKVAIHTLEKPIVEDIMKTKEWKSFVDKKLLVNENYTKSVLKKKEWDHWALKSKAKKSEEAKRRSVVKAKREADLKAKRAAKDAEEKRMEERARQRLRTIGKTEGSVVNP
jgi:hypothetical protein